MKQPEKMSHLPAEQTETGRSMVEMLGVLAIIGVLSIGGISGYMLAMNRHHSNNILNGVSTRAVMISQQMIMGRAPEHPADLAADIDGYAVAVEMADDFGTDFFDVSVSGIPVGPCRYVLGQNWGTPVGIYLNDSLDPAENGDDCKETDNTITFVFDATLNANAQATGKCVGVNVGECGVCDPETGRVRDDDDKCPETWGCSNKTCVECLTGDTLITLADGTCKRLDQIMPGDQVLSINPETGTLEADEVSESDALEHKEHTEYDVWTFSDNTVIKTVHPHRFYNLEQQRMVYMAEWKMGEHAYTREGRAVALVSHEHITKTVRHYTLFTKKWNNYFANNLLSGNRYTPDMHLTART